MDAQNRNDQLTEPVTEEAAGLIRRVAEGTRETAARAKEGLAAGASGVLEFTKTAAHETREKAGRVVEFVKEAAPDEQLKASVSISTEQSLDKAADVVIGAAPAIGRNAELAAEKLGQALHAVARPLAAILGVIAGTVGGWWKKAAEERHELPSHHEQACRTHFATVTLPPPGMTFEKARTGYELGYLASRNPTYRGRSFVEIEPDLQLGFGPDRAAEYDDLRDFASYGYSRGTGSDL
ncbi:hypothetical protein BH23GEM6_BH23GEM6_07000 [soil metagenome]